MAYFPLGPLAPDRNPRLNDEVLRVADAWFCSRFVLGKSGRNAASTAPGPDHSERKVRPMAKREILSSDELRQLLDYDPATGKLFWKERPDAAARWNTRYAGKEAFTSTNNNGYRQGRIHMVNNLAHRVIWALAYGRWPDFPREQIDHINGDRCDNRLENMRLVDATANARNAAMPKSNTSGQVGVCFVAKTNKWRVRLNDQELGYFEDKGEAIRVRKKAEADGGYHPNHGRAKVA